MKNKWQTALTTNPSVANTVGVLLDIIDNCNYQLNGSPVDDGEKIIAFIKTDDDIIIPLQLRYTVKQK